MQKSRCIGIALMSLFFLVMSIGPVSAIDEHVYGVTYFTINLQDNTPPDSVGFMLPTPVNDTNLTQDNYFINVSFNDSNPGSCLIELTGATNYTMTQGANSSEYYRNITGLSNGMTYFQAYCGDLSGNWNYSEIRFVNISSILIQILNMTVYDKGMEWMKWNWTASAGVATTECELYGNGVRIELFNTTLQTYNRSFLNEDVKYNLTCRGYGLSGYGSWAEISERTKSVFDKTIVNLKILRNWLSRLLGTGGMI